MCTGDMAAQLRSISVRVIVRAVPEFVFQHDVNMSHVGRGTIIDQHVIPIFVLSYAVRANILFCARRGVAGFVASCMTVSISFFLPLLNAE